MVGVLSLLLCLVIRIPATVLPPFLERISHGRLELDVAGGTIWRGQMTELRWTKKPLLGQVSWQLGGWRLLVGRLELRLSDSRHFLDLETSPALQQLTIRSNGFSFPVDGLVAFRPALQTYRMRGTLALQSTGFSIGAEPPAGDMSLRLHDAGSDLVALPALGTYHLLLSPVRQGLRGTLRTEQGELGVQGSGHWHPGRGTSVRLELQPRSSSEALKPLLSLAGRPAANGAYYLNASFP